MELQATSDRKLKSESNYERYNNIDEDVEVEDLSSFTYQLPVPKSKKKNGLMLELDACNGHWLIAASAKKYVPVGVADNVDAAMNVLTQVRNHKAPGYIVVADENELPFQRDLFDLVWRFSPYQESEKNGIDAFAERTSHVMAKSGLLKIAARKVYAHQHAFSKHLTKVHNTIRSCFGTLALKKIKENTGTSRNFGSIASKTLASLSGYIPVINRFADSIFINARKEKGSPNFRIHHFLKHHWLRENLNIVYLLQCPMSGGLVYLSKDANFIISDHARVKYPVINGIPIMLRSAAIPTQIETSLAVADSRRVLGSHM